MTKARDIASAAPAPSTVSATELGYLDGVSSAIQTQIDSKIGSASAINPTIVDAKGDLLVGSAADTVARLAVGTNDYVLTADSSATNGVKWAAAGGSSNGPAFSAYRSTNQTFSNSTWTKISFDSEKFDTDTDFASGTFTPSKAGYYQLNTAIRINGGTETYGAIYKNGNSYTQIFGYGSSTTKQSGGVLVYANGTTDYFEVYGYGTGGTPNFAGDGDGNETNFNGVWIRD